MGAPLQDITLYTPTSYQTGTPEYWEERSLINYISDLYHQKMFGYKPPKTSRITIQPSFHGVWQGSNHFGSIVSIAPYFNYDDYKRLDKEGKYHYLLNLIQGAMIQLCDERGWDIDVFKRAFKEVIACDFKFQIDYQQKLSRDKQKHAWLCVEKTETITTVFVKVERNDSVIKRKLFDKKNAWWYDCVYPLARHAKWFDNGRFGINYRKGGLEIWYSIDQDAVQILENGEQVTEIDFRKYFLFQ